MVMGRSRPERADSGRDFPQQERNDMAFSIFGRGTTAQLTTTVNAATAGGPALEQTAFTQIQANVITAMALFDPNQNLHLMVSGSVDPVRGLQTSVIIQPVNLFDGVHNYKQLS